MSQGARIWHGPNYEVDTFYSKNFKSLGHYLLDKLKNEQADQVILTDDKTGATWTGAQMYERILTLACALVDKYAIDLGTPVSIRYQNSDTLYLLGLALVCAGAIVSTIHHKDPYEELSYSAHRIGTKFLVCEEKYCDNWSKRLSEELGHPVKPISIDGGGSNSLSDLLSYDRAQSRDQVPRIPQDVKTQVAFIVMSSGTTGKPKAVTSTHYTCLMEMMVVQPFRIPGFSKGTPIACHTSLDYISGRLQLLTAIEFGYNAVVLRGFEPETFARAIEKHQISVVYIGAAGFYNFITWPQLNKYDLSSLRVIFPMGAKVIYLDELRRFLNVYPRIRMVRQGYGSSETSCVAINNLAPELYLNDCENAGKLYCCVSAKILDPDTNVMLGPNQTGIIYVKSEIMFPGYYDRSLISKQGSPLLAGAGIFDEEGYYNSGDLAYFNEKEELYILGRQKEMMNCRETKKVLPQELESVLDKHPAVKKVCVIGIPNKKIALLHCPRAFVVPKEEVFANPSIIETIRTSRPRESPVDDEEPNGENTEGFQELKLMHSGNPDTKLSSLDCKWRRELAEDLMEFTNERVGWRKQLTGGLVILDDIPIMRETGKMNKSLLRSLTKDSIELYGDLSE